MNTNRVWSVQTSFCLSDPSSLVLQSEKEESLAKAHQTVNQLQTERTQFLHQLDNCQNAMDKLQRELEEKHQVIEQIQNDLSERSAQQVNINNQLTQESKTRLSKIAELEQHLVQEQQRVRERFSFVGKRPFVSPLV